MPGPPLYFVSDLHFGHAAVLEKGGRPWPDVPTMNAELVDVWNATVSEDAHVWILGDVAFLSDEPLAYWLGLLRGKLHLILGNHDSESEADEAVEAGVLEEWHPVRYLRHNRQKFWLSHYPHLVWPNCGRTDAAHSYHLHGDTHGDLRVENARMLDVGVDSLAEIRAREASRARLPEDYAPISFEEVVARVGDNPPVDRHPATPRTLVNPGGTFPDEPLEVHWPGKPLADVLDEAGLL